MSATQTQQIGSQEQHYDVDPDFATLVNRPGEDVIDQLLREGEEQEQRRIDHIPRNVHTLTSNVFGGPNQGGQIPPPPNQRRNSNGGQYPGGGNPGGNPGNNPGNPGGPGGNPPPNFGFNQGQGQGNNNHRASELKYDAPPKFDGTAKSYQRWKENCGLFIIAQPNKFPTDHESILFMLYHMEGAAIPWRTDFIKRHINGANRLVFNSLEDLLNEMDATFLPWNYMEDNLRALHHFKQHGRPVDYYISQFRVLASQAGMVNPSELIFRFREGLDYEIGQRTIQRAPANTLTDWIAAARTAEAIYRTELDHRRSHGRLKSHGTVPPQQFKTPHYPNRTQAPSRQRDPYAMEIDALETAINNFAIDEGYDQSSEQDFYDNEVNNTEEEEDNSTDVNELVHQRVQSVLNEILTSQQKQALQSKQCFNCGKTGHYARNCKAPKKALPRPQIAKTFQNKRPVAPPKFRGNRSDWKKKQFTRINEAIQEIDDEEEVAELYAQHADRDSTASQNVVDFVFDD